MQKRQLSVVIFRSLVGLAVCVSGCVDKDEVLSQGAEESTPTETMTYAERIAGISGLCVALESTTISGGPRDCFPYHLAPPDGQSCDICGPGKNHVIHDMMVVQPNENATCPDAMYDGLVDSEKQFYISKQYRDTDGNLHCITPQVATSFECDEAASDIASYSQNPVGWYLCQGEWIDGCNFPTELHYTDALENTLETAELFANPPLSKSFIVKELPLLDVVCNQSGERMLGDYCTPAQFDPLTFSISGRAGHIELQQNCVCLSFEPATSDYQFLTQLAQFCTQPCDDAGCPEGYACETMLPDIVDLPNDIPHRYCVPECLKAKPCSPHQKCTATDTHDNDTVEWRCFPEK